LQRLELGDNRLTRLPRELILLNLEFVWIDEMVEKGINLYGNPLRVPPPEVIQQGRQAVIEYFEKRGQ
jgi:hypothetical protein